ncbi:MAG: hypothetical protein GX606_07325 [Elusimicrobia bacterium]|nr:hypothetical protein [Elusimicrobiota bacterium]
MRHFFLLLTLVLLGISVFFLVRLYQENQESKKALDQERYQRMVAEEDLQRGEYRIKRLEADLQTTQIKLLKLQQDLDLERSERDRISKEISDLEARKAGLEADLKAERLRQEQSGREPSLSADAPAGVVQ